MDWRLFVGVPAQEDHIELLVFKHEVSGVLLRVVDESEGKDVFAADLSLSEAVHDLGSL